jgi:hypothetical protein
MPATSKLSRSAKAALVAAVVAGSAASTSTALAQQPSDAPRAGANAATSPAHGPSITHALKKLDRHARRVARRAAHRRPRVSAHTSDVVHTEGGLNGNYTTWEFRGCSQFASGGYQWQACKFDWFFAGQSQFTTWDYYYAYAGAWWRYGTYRCETPARGGACGWV